MVGPCCRWFLVAFPGRLLNDGDLGAVLRLSHTSIFRGSSGPVSWAHLCDASQLWRKTALWSALRLVDLCGRLFMEIFIAIDQPYQRNDQQGIYSIPIISQHTKIDLPRYQVPVQT
jgi:hypothetical protein